MSESKSTAVCHVCFDGLIEVKLLYSCVVRLQVEVANGGVVGCVPRMNCEIHSCLLFPFVRVICVDEVTTCPFGLSLLFGIEFLFFLEVR
jgi:hypothetical protein